MKTQAELREVLRRHREQRATLESNDAHPSISAVPSPSSIPPSHIDRLPSTATVQALLPLTPTLKEPLLQSGDAAFSSAPEIESPARKRRRGTSESSQISPSNGEEDNERGSSEDISSASDTSDEGGEATGSDEERERQALWTIFSKSFAELVGSEAQQSSIQIASSPDQDTVAALRRPAASAASQSFATTKKPSGQPADPIEIDSS